MSDLAAPSLTIDRIDYRDPRDAGELAEARAEILKAGKVEVTIHAGDLSKPGSAKALAAVSGGAPGP